MTAIFQEPGNNGALVKDPGDLKTRIALSVFTSDTQMCPEVHPFHPQSFMEMRHISPFCMICRTADLSDGLVTILSLIPGKRYFSLIDIS